MKLEDQVVSLEIARALKGLGVEQESLFYWEENKINKGFKGRIVSGNPSITNDWAIPSSAFTVAELGELLPNIIGDYVLDQIKTIDDQYGLIYRNNGKWLHSVGEDTEANARGEMLIYLIENDLIKDV